jgi:hypothetical protein
MDHLDQCLLSVYRWRVDICVPCGLGYAILTYFRSQGLVIFELFQAAVHNMSNVAGHNFLPVVSELCS